MKVVKMWNPPRPRPPNLASLGQSLGIGLCLMLWAVFANTAFASSSLNSTASRARSVLRTKPLLHLKGTTPMSGLNQGIGLGTRRAGRLQESGLPKTTNTPPPTKTSGIRPGTNPLTPAGAGIKPLNGTGFPLRTPTLTNLRPKPKPGANISGSSFKALR